RSAGSDIFLPAERNCPISAVPRFYIYPGPIDKHNFPPYAKKSRPGCRDLFFANYIVTILTCFLSLPNLSNLTTPDFRAKSVSSLPFPTLAPGWIFVPLCLTMILPASTYCPSPLLTPSLLASLSRPFLVLPTPFL